jgi:hypothetical protein
MIEESETGAQELKGFGSQTVAISACGPEDGEPKAKEAGAAAFLDKMRLYADLIPKIRELALGAGPS